MSAERSSSISVRIDVGEIAQVDALRLVRRSHEVLIHRLGQERHDRREQLRQRQQHRVQRLIGGQLVVPLVALPEAAAVAADVPVAQLVIDELLRLQAERHQVEALERRACRTGSAVASRTESSGRCRAVRGTAPAARRGRSRRAGRSCRRTVGVPQLQRELAAQLLRRTGAEVDVAGRIVPADTSSGSGRRSSAGYVVATLPSLGSLSSVVTRRRPPPRRGWRCPSTCASRRPTGRAPGRGRAAP